MFNIERMRKKIIKKKLKDAVIYAAGFAYNEGLVTGFNFKSKDARDNFEEAAWNVFLSRLYDGN